MIRVRRGVALSRASGRFADPRSSSALEPCRGQQSQFFPRQPAHVSGSDRAPRAGITPGFPKVERVVLNALVKAALVAGFSTRCTERNYWPSAMNIVFGRSRSISLASLFFL